MPVGMAVVQGHREAVGMRRVHGRSVPIALVVGMWRRKKRAMRALLLLLLRRRSSKEGPVRDGALRQQGGGIAGLQLSDGGFFPDRSHPGAFVVSGSVAMAEAILIVVVVMDIVSVLQGAVVGRNRDRRRRGGLLALAKVVLTGVFFLFRHV